MGLLRDNMENGTYLFKSVYKQSYIWKFALPPWLGYNCDYKLLLEVLQLWNAQISQKLKN